MLHIALIGYGKMGQAIEKIAIERGHTISLKISQENHSDLNEVNIKKANVAIEFSTPESAEKNILFCLQNNIPVISGTTGWNSEMDEVEKVCRKYNGAFLYASNFSVGVNLFFELNKKLASLLKNHPEYNVSLEEIHHTQKKDTPSGTAITLADEIINQSLRKRFWVNDKERQTEELSVISKRINDVPGTHSVKYTSETDDISIVHTAHNRTGFASGAVSAAEYIYDKKGIFTMKDVLNL